jgi:hypothetical protein
MLLVLACLGTTALAEVTVDVKQCPDYLNDCGDIDTSYIADCEASLDFDIPVQLKSYLVTVHRDPTTCGVVCPDSREYCEVPDDCVNFQRIVVPKSDQGEMLLCAVTEHWSCQPDEGSFVCERETGKDQTVKFLVSPRVGRVGDARASVYPSEFSSNEIDHDTDAGPDDDVPTIIDTVGIPASSWWSIWLLVLALLGSIIFFVMRMRRAPSS